MLAEDFKKFKSVSDPQISPDGKRILFTVTTVNEKEDGYNGHIWEVPSIGGKPRQFTYGDGRDSNPLWSPDGKNILFLSSRGKDKGVVPWVIPAQGGEARPVCSEPKGVEKPVWCPDGKNILFLSRVKTEENPWNKKSDVKVIRKLVYKEDNFFHDTRRHLFVVEADSGQPKQLTKGEFDVVSADWSPDGKNIVFVANMTGEQDYTLIKNVWVISYKGEKPRRLTDGKWQIDSVSCSPDGKKIAFLGREIPDEKFIVQRNPKIWVMPSKGSVPVNVTDRFDEWIVPFHSCIPGWSEAPVWSHDSAYVYFKANEKGSAHVYRVYVKDHDIQRMTDGKITVSSFSLSRDGSKLAFNAGGSLCLSEVWVSDGKGVRRLTDMNETLLKGAELSNPEVFWFIASDGVKIQGWIMKPVGFREGKKYPTILEIHGGPYGAYGYSFSHEFQVFASNGFAVVYTNPRSSLGYGEKFSAQAGHWGERDYQDIMEAVDYVEKSYSFVDPERLGVTGGSYGGFMTNWIVGHTDRFKAALAERSISNWYSFHGAGDIGAMPWLPTHDIGLGKNPWDALDLYFEKSPISYVKNVKTPLMLIVADEDWDCTIDQSEQMFVALKKLKKETELIIFPGENHNLSRTGKPGHRVERYEHMLRWFNKYLK